jgi:hypothetical protein
LVAVAIKLTLLPWHTVTADGLIVTDGTTDGVTCTTILFDTAVAGDAQATDDDIRQVTVSLLFKVELINWLLLPPVAWPLTIHWYAGVVPALVAVAVNVTVVPWQILVEVALILTPALTDVVICTATLLDVATSVPEHELVTVTTQLILSVADIVVIV